MIEWLTGAAHEARRGGLWLCNGAHFRYPSDPTGAFPAQRERTAIEGLGWFDTWFGIADGTPFSIMAQRSPFDGTSFGLEIDVPIAADTDLAIIAAIAQLVPRGFTASFFDFFPIASGYAVGDVYVGATRAEAEAVAALVHADVVHRTIVPVDHIVVGPARDGFFTRGARRLTLERATALADRWRRETGEPFTVTRSLRP